MGKFSKRKGTWEECIQDSISQKEDSYLMRII